LANNTAWINNREGGGAVVVVLVLVLVVLVVTVAFSITTRESACATRASSTAGSAIIKHIIPTKILIPRPASASSARR
jgi:heme/copper-type cytochrome/quinol oxidase subunit 2